MFSFLRFLDSRFRRALRAAGRLLSLRSSRRGGALPRLFRALWRPVGFILSGLFRAIRWPFGLLLKVASEWRRTRSLRTLLLGLPAVLIFAGVGYALLAAGTVDRTQLVRKYQDAAQVALERENHRAAILYLERLLQLEAGGNDVVFDLARAAQKLHDYPRVASAMQLLAPEDRPVHAPSHLWQATTRLSRQPMSPEDIRVAEIHLRHALRLRPTDMQANQLMGELQFALGHAEAAIPYLTQAVATEPSRKLMLAKALVIVGHAERARRVAREAQEHYERQVVEHPDDQTHKLNLSESCLFLEEYERAAEILRQELAVRDDRTVRQALARVLVAWCDALAGTPPVDRARQLELLSAGLHAYPDEVLIFDRLLTLLRRRDETAEAAKEFLQQAIVDGRAVGLCHLVLGANAFEAGDVTQSTYHLERAFEALPNADIVANNLAWTLIQIDPPEARRALGLIEPVVARNPNGLRFLDTRGHVYLKLGRYRDAIRDLERALTIMRDNAATHVALAEAYGYLGMKDLAEKHRLASRGSSPPAPLVPQD